MWYTDNAEARLKNKKWGGFNEFYQLLDTESIKLFYWIVEKERIMDETWLKELNQWNLELEGEDSSKWNCVTVSVPSSVLIKLSQAEK